MIPPPPKKKNVTLEVDHRTSQKCASYSVLLYQVLYLCFHPDISKNVPKLVLFFYTRVYGVCNVHLNQLDSLWYLNILEILGVM